MARTLSGNENWGDATIKGDVAPNGVVADYHHGYPYNIERHDPVLIRVLEHLGSAANGPYANIKLLDVPSGIRYRIENNDGYETVIREDEVASYNWKQVT